MSEEIKKGELSGSILMKREDLASGIREELKAIPVSVVEVDDKVTIVFQGMLISGVEIGEEAYKIFNVSREWASQTSYLCEDKEDGTRFYYLETIDECIGEMKRLIMFEAMKGNKQKSETTKMIGRIMQRQKWVDVLKPVFEGTDLEVLINPTPNEESVITRKIGTTKPQLVAIWIKQKATHVVLGKPTKELIEDEIDLPKEDKYKNNQYHYRNVTDQFIMDVCMIVAQKHKKQTLF